MFGSSSGAIVALHLLARRPELVTTLVAHEPPLFPLLPDGDAILAQLDGFHQRFRDEGPVPAMTEFSAAMGIARTRRPPSRPALRRDDGPRRHQHHVLVRERVRALPARRPRPRRPRAAGERLVFGCGRESRGNPPARPARVLAEELGRPIVEFPGGHVGYAQAPAEFAEVLACVLTAGR